jgi:hydroxymethylpyrimidine/phosphomethylpyrimidine kinase
VTGTIPNVLSIAGSDPSGGAGIQADLKTFSALGSYGMAALTALTAQNTRGVTAVHPVPVDFIRRQIDTVFEDVAVHAVKVGMIGSAEAVATVAECLAEHAPAAIVVDPVMVAKSGHRLIDDDAVRILRDRLLPLASLVTPNLPEAQVLLGDTRPAGNRAAMPEVGRRLQVMLGTTVLLKGGHLDDGGSPDLLVRDAREDWFESERVATRSTHGTGCTLSSACAASLALTGDLAGSVAQAKAYLTEALKSASRLSVGHGHGPVDHFHRFR